VLSKSIQNFIPLFWGVFKVVKSAFRRIYLIKDFLFKALGRIPICGSSPVIRRKRCFWGLKDMPFI
jgi:hypothetical protein